MNERELRLKVIEQAETIAKAISRGKDVELRKSASGRKRNLKWVSFTFLSVNWELLKVF